VQKKKKKKKEEEAKGEAPAVEGEATPDVAVTGDSVQEISGDEGGKVID
jgi:hypothetical protein